MSQTQPLVSIVTPVYNGESYLSVCIESVLAQTYANWELIIVNNCSTDRTLEIAERYRSQDARIHIYETDKLLSAIENHNFTVSKISPESQYCKILHADDWLFSECLVQMVDVAVSNSTVGVIGSFCLAGKKVQCDGLPYPGSLITGHEICRLTLLGKIYPFWSPSSTMIRSDLVRNREYFYKLSGLHADVEMMYEILQQCDFGFVHQVLTYNREHSESETTRLAKPLNTLIWANMDLFVRFAPVFLNEQEFSKALNQRLNKYYQFLANSFWEGRNLAFWRYHQNGLRTVGYPLSYFRLSGAIIGTVVCDFRRTVRGILRRLGLR